MGLYLVDDDAAVQVISVFLHPMPAPLSRDLPSACLYLYLYRTLTTYAFLPLVCSC